MEIIRDKVVEQLPTSSPSPPPSSSSSPSHEFSFTISLHSDKTNKTTANPPPPSSFAIDLSPADEIFFHGHLLPLHLLSHLPVSPRSSTNSMDSFTLPINEDHHHHHQNKQHTSNSDSNIIINNNHHHHQENKNYHLNHNHNSTTQGRPKSKSFSIFGFSRRKKGIEDSEEEKKPKKKKRVRFDVIKKYMNMVLFRGGRRSRREDNDNVGYSSYSGNLSFRNKKEVVMMRGRRGEFSAPASIRTSPSNSGLLLPCSTSTDSSTMEELQQAIQAAIAHCKNSIAADDKLNSSI